VNPGVWKVTTGKDQVSFGHSLSGGNWAYEYQKKIILAKGRPDMQLSHSLKNTGTSAIETNVYNHNFFVMDKQTTGPASKLNFRFNLPRKLQQPRNSETGRKQHCVF
jgi:hypothetical protein